LKDNFRKSAGKFIKMTDKESLISIKESLSLIAQLFIYEINKPKEKRDDDFLEGIKNHLLHLIVSIKYQLKEY